jgi:hypothetical protein
MTLLLVQHMFMIHYIILPFYSITFKYNNACLYLQNGPRNQLSPISIARTDSVTSLEFRSSGVIGPSRGPSPLTIGLSDSIPLAVAFHEIIHAYFKGSNESRYLLIC